MVISNFGQMSVNYFYRYCGIYGDKIIYQKYTRY